MIFGLLVCSKLAIGTEAGFVDAANFDFHLKAASPCIGKGVDPGKFGDFPLTPEFQYGHPAKSEKRPADGKLDVGAYELPEAGPGK